MSVRIRLAVVATIASGIFVLGLQLWRPQEMAAWFELMQGFGTVAALFWLAGAAAVQAEQLAEGKRNSNRQVVLDSLNIFAVDLQGLMQAIVEQIGILKTKEQGYRDAFAGGERLIYVAPLTAANGTLLGRMVRDYHDKNDRLRRRLNTYVSVFESVRNVAVGDQELLKVIDFSPYGRVFWTIKAALSAEEDQATKLLEKIEAFREV